MMSETFTPDKLIAGDFPIVTEAGTLLSGQNTVRGALLGKVAFSVGAAVAGSNTGNGTVGSISAGTQTVLGVYTLKCVAAATNSGTFTVTDPQGDALPDATVAVAYTNGQINFTIADGSTDFIVGDSFTITVSAGSGKYKLSLAAATDGSQYPHAILADDTDATSADAACIVYLTGEFNSGAMTFGTGHTASSTKATLRGLGIHLKTSVAA